MCVGVSKSFTTSYSCITLYLSLFLFLFLFSPPPRYVLSAEFFAAWCSYVNCRPHEFLAGGHEFRASPSMRAIDGGEGAGDGDGGGRRSPRGRSASGGSPGGGAEGGGGGGGGGPAAPSLRLRGSLSIERPTEIDNNNLLVKDTGAGGEFNDIRDGATATGDSVGNGAAVGASSSGTPNFHQLRKGLSLGADYILVSSRVWHALSSWYGGGPAIPRRVVAIRDRDDEEEDAAGETAAGGGKGAGRLRSGAELELELYVERVLE